MASQGPNLATSGADDATIGTLAWTNPGNVTAQDGTLASVSFVAVAQSHYLDAKGFGFTIPTTATINGILVEVFESRGAGKAAIADNAARLIIGGVIQATNRTGTGAWPATAAWISYGGAADLWGSTITATQVNDTANFGVAISAKSTTTGSNTANIDAVRITVFYTALFDPSTGFPYDQSCQVYPSRAFQQSQRRIFEPLHSPAQPAFFLNDPAKAVPALSWFNQQPGPFPFEGEMDGQLWRAAAAQASWTDPTSMAVLPSIVIPPADAWAQGGFPVPRPLSLRREQGQQVLGRIVGQDEGVVVMDWFREWTRPSPAAWRPFRPDPRFEAQGSVLVQPAGVAVLLNWFADWPRPPQLLPRAAASQTAEPPSLATQAIFGWLTSQAFPNLWPRRSQAGQTVEAPGHLQPPRLDWLSGLTGRPWLQPRLLAVPDTTFVLPATTEANLYAFLTQGWPVPRPQDLRRPGPATVAVELPQPAPLGMGWYSAFTDPVPRGRPWRPEASGEWAAVAWLPTLTPASLQTWNAPIATRPLTQARVTAGGTDLPVLVQGPGLALDWHVPMPVPFRSPPVAARWCTFARGVPPWVPSGAIVVAGPYFFVAGQWYAWGAVAGDFQSE